MPTLKSIIESDVSDVFLDTDEMAESLYLFKGGDQHQKVEFDGHVFRDDEEGTREVHGDGVVRNQEQGDRIRRSVKIDCDVSVAFDDTRDPPDIVKVIASGEVFVLKRILARDVAMQRVLCVRVDKLTEAYPVRRG